jgi:hypothetical protein
MNLNDILQAAQGGQGLDNLAARFGLSPAETQAAVQAIIPALSGGLQRATQDPNALGGILSHLTSGEHAGSYADPDQANPAAGGSVLGQIFGSPQVVAQVGDHASRMSGIDPQIIQQMMPLVASMLMGGLSHAMNSQGLGGALGKLASGGGAPASDDDVPPDPTLPAPAAESGGGWLGGLVGAVIGAVTGGPQQGGASGESGLMQAGLSALTSMLEPGVPVSAAHQQGLDNILDAAGK